MQPEWASKLYEEKKISSFPAVGLGPASAIFGLAILLLTLSGTVQATPPKNTVVATINIGALPGSVVCSADGKFVYVTISGGIAIIDASPNTLSSDPFAVPRRLDRTTVHPVQTVSS